MCVIPVYMSGYQYVHVDRDRVRGCIMYGSIECAAFYLDLCSAHYILYLIQSAGTFLMIKCLREYSILFYNVQFQNMK